MEAKKIAPDEIEIRWRVFRATLYYRRPAPEPHKKWLLEYKRKTERRPRWYIMRQQSLERAVQRGATVA